MSAGDERARMRLVPAAAQYKLDSDIPLPPPNRRKWADFPLDVMQPGQSFFVPVPEGGEVTQGKLRDRMSNTVNGFSKVNKGMRFAVRLWPGGVRVWCTQAPPPPEPPAPPRRKPGRKPKV